MDARDKQRGATVRGSWTCTFTSESIWRVGTTGSG